MMMFRLTCPKGKIIRGKRLKEGVALNRGFTAVESVVSMLSLCLDCIIADKRISTFWIGFLLNLL